MGAPLQTLTTPVPLQTPPELTEPQPRRSCGDARAYERLAAREGGYFAPLDAWCEVRGRVAAAQPRTNVSCHNARVLMSVSVTTQESDVLRARATPHAVSEGALWHSSASGGGGGDDDAGDDAPPAGPMRLLAAYVDAVTFRPRAAERAAAALRALVGAPARPDVVYFGFGQWLFWPVPFAADVDAWTTFPYFECAAEDAAEALRRYRAVATRAVVLTTPHSVCDDALTGERKAAVERFKAAVLARGGGDAAAAAALGGCARFLRGIYGSATSSNLTAPGSEGSDAAPPARGVAADEAKEGSLEKDAAKCAAGLRSRRAARALSHRLARTTREAMAPPPPPPPRPPRAGAAAAAAPSARIGAEGEGTARVALVDAFALTDGRCDANLVGDSLHFHALLYDELTLLFEQVGWNGHGVVERAAVGYSPPTAPLQSGARPATPQRRRRPGRGS